MGNGSERDRERYIEKEGKRKIRIDAKTIAGMRQIGRDKKRQNERGQRQKQTIQRAQEKKIFDAQLCVPLL